MLADNLEHKIQNRPQPEDLIEQGILEEDEDPRSPTSWVFLLWWFSPRFVFVSPLFFARTYSTPFFRVSRLLYRLCFWFIHSFLIESFIISLSSFLPFLPSFDPFWTHLMVMSSWCSSIVPPQSIIFYLLFSFLFFVSSFYIKFIFSLNYYVMKCTRNELRWVFNRRGRAGISHLSLSHLLTRRLCKDRDYTITFYS